MAMRLVPFSTGPDLVRQGNDDEDRVSMVSVSVASMTAAPAVVVTTAPAPAVMMAAPATMHVAVSVAMLDLNDRIVLRLRGNSRRHSEPRGSRCHHRKRRGKYRSSDQCNSSHSLFPPVPRYATYYHNFLHLISFPRQG